MADIIVGYAPQITVTGNSVYWARGEYDAQIFSEFTTSHYIANQTDSDTKQITANNGLQADGSWKMTVADASSWTTGDRAIPQIGSAYAQYNTVALAWAARASYDNFRLCYSSTGGRKTFLAFNAGAATNDAINVHGMIPHVCVYAPNNGGGYNINGNMAWQTTQFVIRNITFLGGRGGSLGGNGQGVYYYDTSGAGAGVVVDRCVTYTPYCGITFESSSKANSCIAKNSIFIGAFAGAIFNSAQHMYNCVSVGCEYGMAFNNTVSTVKNCFSCDCSSASFFEKNSVTGSNNASDDSTAPGTGPVSCTRAQARFICDVYGMGGTDFRIAPDSDLYGAGVAVSGVTHDLDGIAWTASPSIGASNTPPFLEVIPATGNIIKDVVATNVYGSNTTGTYEGTITNPDYVIHSQGGNWIDENVTAGNLLVGVTAGVGGAIVGTFDEAARNTIPDLTKIPTEATGGPAAWKQLNVNRSGTLDLDAAKIAFETGRNNDNGTVAADISTGKTVKIRNVTITGTNDKTLSAAEEIVRNTDPGIANVLITTPYKIHGTNLVGTLPSGGAVTYPTAPTLAMAGQSDGSHVLATISGSDAGAVNSIYAARVGTTTATLLGTITGNGSATYTLAAVGNYRSAVVSQNATGGRTTALGPDFSIASASSADGAWDAAAEDSREVFHDVFSVPVVYSRGGSSMSVNAIAAVSMIDEQNADGDFIRTEIRTFDIDAEDLSLGLPAKGDVITETIDGVAKRYEVAPNPSRKSCYDWSDSTQREFRIYTKYIGT